jgi:putative ABC transport system permease protein
MRWLPWLALRELWSRRWRSLLSLLALALSVGLVVATGSIGALMQASVARPIPLLGRPADLWVSSAFDVDYDLPAGLQARVEAVPGVTEVQPVLRRPVRVQTPRPDTLTLMGVEPAPYFAFHDLTLAVGELPSVEAPGLVALAPWAFIRDLGLGQPVTVTTPAGEVELPIAGLIEVKSLATAQQGLVIYAPLDTVAALFGLDNVITVLEVRLAPGASPRRVRAELEQSLGPAYAVSVGSLAGQGVQLWQRLVLGALVFVDGLILAGSASLVYAVFASAARARRRQIGLLRAVGAERRQVLALLVTEAILLGLTGSGLGLVTGFLFARLSTGLVLRGSALSSAGVAQVFAIGGDVPVLPPLPARSLLLGVTLGVLGSLAGAIGPALGATRQSPLAALRTVLSQSYQHHSRGQLGRTLIHLPRRWASVMCLFPAEVRLAAANLARERGRTALIVGTLALILGMALGDVGVLSLLGDQLAASFGWLSGGDYLVLPGLATISLRELAGQDTSDMPPLDPGLLATLENMGDQVWLMGGTTANIEALQVFPGQPTLLLDIEGYARMGGFRFQAGDWPGALEAFQQGPAVLLAPVVARRLNVGLGDQVRLETLQGVVDFSVAGIGDSEFTTCVLNLADGATYFGANEVNAVEVKVRPGADPDTVRRALLDAIQSHAGTLLSLSQASAQLRGMFHEAQVSIGLLIGVTGLVAGLGVVNAMLASVAERRREIGLLRAAGATRSQVSRLIIAEMAMLGTAAALIGTALGWIATFLFVGVARAYLPAPVAAAPLSLTGGGMASLAGWLPLLVASLAGLALWPLLAVLGGLGPAIHVARLPVIQALYETAPP